MVVASKFSSEVRGVRYVMMALDKLKLMWRAGNWDFLQLLDTATIEIWGKYTVEPPNNGHARDPAFCPLYKRGFPLSDVILYSVYNTFNFFLC